MAGVSFGNLNVEQAIPACYAAYLVTQDPRITLQLGRAYDKLGTQAGQLQAARMYRKSAENGSGIAMANLSQMYQEGRGVEKDTLEAVRWFRKAAEAGLNLTRHTR